MITIDEILSHSTEKQLESMKDAAFTIMQSMQDITGLTLGPLAGECETYWLNARLQQSCLQELGERYRGKERLEHPN